jgi:hypothetical protein
MSFGSAFGAGRVVFGGVTMTVAIADPDHVAFAGDIAQIAMGVVGAATVFLGARALMDGDATPPDMTRQRLLRRRIYGAAVFFAGLWFAVATLSDGSRAGLRLDGWVALVHGLGGALMVVQGLALQFDPTGLRKKSRVVRGAGVRTTATVLRATDLGTLKGKAKVKVDLTFAAGGREERHSAKTLMDRATLAHAEGATVDVLVDPSDPAIFDVKWDTLREAAPRGP